MGAPKPHCPESPASSARTRLDSGPTCCRMEDADGSRSFLREPLHRPSFDLLAFGTEKSIRWTGTLSNCHRSTVLWTSEAELASSHGRAAGFVTPGSCILKTRIDDQSVRITRAFWAIRQLVRA